MPLSEEERLDVLCLQIQDAGFESIGDAIVALLNHTASNPDLRTRIQRHTTALFEGPGLNDICHAVMVHPQCQKNRKTLFQQDAIRKFATSVSREVVVQELHALSRIDDMHIPLTSFSQPQIDKFSFEYLDEIHETNAPVLRSFLMAVVEPYRPPRASALEPRALETLALLEGYDTDAESEPGDFNPAADPVSAAQRATEYRGRNRKQVAMAALSMLAYAHSKNSNYYQLIMGYHAFASGVKKRAMETFHQLGYMVSYESVVRALNANAVATQELLREKARTHRFLLSFDNLNFFRSKRDQSSLNREHMANYTAGFAVFMEEGPHLLPSSVDHTRINQLSIRDVVVDSSAIKCHQDAARAFACKLLSGYFKKSFRSQTVRNSAGKWIPKYLTWEPPLMNEQCSLEKADILPLPTLAKNEALIVETMDILQEYVDILGIASELGSMKIIVNGDLMTVRNITRSIHRRQDEDFQEDKLDWAEPMPGLFHTQMTALKMMFGVFWGEPVSTVSLCRFVNILRRKKITKRMVDFHHCEQFFLLLVEGFWLALIATECGCKTWEELELYIANKNWHAAIDRVTSAYVNPYVVHHLGRKAEKKVQRQAKKDITRWRNHHEAMVASGLFTKRRTNTYWDAKEVEIVKRRLPRERDEVRENALLFLNCGLLFREFHEACRGGYYGRAFKCLEQYVAMFHGSRNKNYAREFLNLRAYMLYAWTPEFKNAFARYCLVNPTGLKGRFHALDRFNEHEIRELKNMIHPSSNPKSDEFFRKTVAFNFISLASVRARVHQATGSTDYGDRHQVVDPLGDLKSVFSELMKDGVFKEKLNRKAASRYKDLIERGVGKTATGVPIYVYKNQARGNWQRGQQSPDGEYAADSDEEVDEDDMQADQAISDED